MFSYLTDPVLQAPTLGSMLMCLSSALVGVVVFLRRRSLLGEALSHAAYPGVVLGVLCMATWVSSSSEFLAVAILVGAFLTSLLGLFVIEKMERKLRVHNDAALCFVLAVFFGVGVLIASHVQSSHALWYRGIQVFLYGQAATMTDIHVVLYALLGLILVGVLTFFYRPIQMSLFDPVFSKIAGGSTQWIDTLVFFLLVLAIVIGIRSVGVVLMAGMLIAPAVAARQLSSRLWAVFVYAACFGALSGFLGNYFSVELPAWGIRQGWQWDFSLPTGPMILLVASAICVLSLLFAPRSGLVVRLVRIMRFRKQCLGDNLLKYLWRCPEGRATRGAIAKWQPLSFIQMQRLLWSLKRQGWIVANHEHNLCLTADGKIRAARIVRLHRLWEAYLVFLGQGVEKVHRSAEEMEHIITPELAERLAELLGDPKKDPHAQPIPPSEPLL